MSPFFLAAQQHSFIGGIKYGADHGPKHVRNALFKPDPNTWKYVFLCIVAIR
jgi:hypothetical protein